MKCNNKNVLNINVLNITEDLKLSNICLTNKVFDKVTTNVELKTMFSVGVEGWLRSYFICIAHYNLLY